MNVAFLRLIAAHVGHIAELLADDDLERAFARAEDLEHELRILAVAIERSASSRGYV